jgi:putative ABC transport system substrate-binding protein
MVSVTQARAMTTAGCLLSYGADLDAMFALAATYVARIARGTNPIDLPVQQPTKYELVINMRTARALGLAIPSSILGRADELIE